MHSIEPYHLRFPPQSNAVRTVCSQISTIAAHPHEFDNHMIRHICYKSPVLTSEEILNRGHELVSLISQIFDQRFESEANAAERRASISRQWSQIAATPEDSRLWNDLSKIAEEIRLSAGIFVHGDKERYSASEYSLS